jgi:hypothetical protein
MHLIENKQENRELISYFFFQVNSLHVISSYQLPNLNMKISITSIIFLIGLASAYALPGGTQSTEQPTLTLAAAEMPAVTPVLLFCPKGKPCQSHRVSASYNSRIHELY